jgi:hypothetical protein
MKSLVFLRNALGTVGILFGAYVALRGLPDLRRYIRISMM